MLDTLFVGAGQTGIIGAAALQREGVQDIAVVDRAAPGAEGPWTTFARMAELRTPKELVGQELGIPALSVRRWFEATYGGGAWETIERLPRQDWKRYLDWFAGVNGVGVDNFVSVLDLGPGPAGTVRVVTGQAGARRVRHARTVVLATGFDGAGAWRVPEFVSTSLPSHRYHHSNGPIDFDAFAGKRIGILGHGASAFDNAIAALNAGCASVDLCFRRAALPRTNPHRHLETAGVMTHYAELPDHDRWAIARHFRLHDQPPPRRSFSEACALPGFRLHPATPWLSTSLQGDDIEVSTPHGSLWFDHLILATGAVVDLESRPELEKLAPLVQRWSDVFSPAAGDEDTTLGALPYLDDGYGFVPKDPTDSWVRSVFAFNACSMVSHGPHSTSISGHRHAMPRLCRGVTRRLFVDHRPDTVARLRAYRSDDLPVADDFEATLLQGALP